MKYNIFFYITIILLLLSQCWLIHQKKTLKEETTFKDKYLEQLAKNNTSLQTQYKSTIDNCRYTLNGKYQMHDTANNVITLANIVSDIKGNFLICRYAENMCHECVAHAVSVIIDNRDSIDANNTIFLSSNSSRRITKLNIKEMDIDGYKVFEGSSLGIPAEEAMFPYIMAVDSSLRVLSVYFPNKSTRGTDYDYKHVKYMYDKLIKGN